MRRDPTGSTSNATPTEFPEITSVGEVRGLPTLRLGVIAAIVVGAAVLASPALAGPSAIPQPTPPPSSGGGGGGGGWRRWRRRRRRHPPAGRAKPAAPVAVKNGKAGAELLVVTGARTRGPVAPAVTPPVTTTPPPATVTTPHPRRPHRRRLPTATAPAVTTPAPVVPVRSRSRSRPATRRPPISRRTGWWC